MPVARGRVRVVLAGQRSGGTVAPLTPRHRCEPTEPSQSPREMRATAMDCCGPVSGREGFEPRVNVFYPFKELETHKPPPGRRVLLWFCTDGIVYGGGSVQQLTPRHKGVAFILYLFFSFLIFYS